MLINRIVKVNYLKKNAFKNNSFVLFGCNELCSRLGAQGQVGLQFKPTGPASLGGGRDYQGPRAGISGNVNHARHFCNDVGVNGNANLWKSHDGRRNNRCYCRI